MNEPCENTDKEIWRAEPGGYYSDSIHVTENGGIGINCGGMVFTKPIRQWHALAVAAELNRRTPEPGQPEAALRKANEPLPKGCYCEPGKCMAPMIMGVQQPCRDPQKAAGVVPPSQPEQDEVEMRGGSVVYGPGCEGTNTKGPYEALQDALKEQGEAEPVADQEALSKMNGALCDFYTRWISDGDYLRCVACKRAHMASRADQKFVHASYCPAESTAEDYPWQALLRILRPLYTRPAPRAAVPDGWLFEVTENDGRTWLHIKTPKGSSAALSAAGTIASGSPTIAAQVLQQLKEALTAAPKSSPDQIPPPPATPQNKDAQSIKTICVSFFHDWYNSPGSNTGQGFDDWWERNSAHYNCEIIDKTELTHLRDNRAVRLQVGREEVWYWQGDGSDVPETIGCPVVMSADNLRSMLNEFVPWEIWETSHARNCEYVLNDGPAPCTCPAGMLEVQEWLRELNDKAPFYRKRKKS